MSSLNRGLEILNITVDISPGKQEQITVYENDEPNMVARDFAAKHNLSQPLELALSRKIYSLVRDIAQEQISLSKTFSPNSEILSSDCKNFGQKLYAKGLRHREQIEANKQLLKMKLDKELEKTHSFHPVISEKSRKLAKHALGKSEVKISEPVAEVEYTFIPKINKKSVNLGSKGLNRIQELYNEGKEKKKRIEEMNLQARKNEFSFRPEVISDERERGEVVDRLLGAKAKYMQNREELRKKYEVTRDPDTAQEFFKPNIGKNYQFLRTTENIWHELYKQQKRPVQMVDHNPYAPVNMDSKVRTEKIILKIKFDKYSEIFHQLNPDDNGQISYDNINFNKVDPLILKLIMPLLEELRDLNEPLYIDDFFDSMDRLLQSLNQADKDVFLTKSKRKIVKQGETVKKSISCCEFKGVYSRQLQMKDKTSAKLEIEREKQKIVEMQDCTFRPQTTKFPNRIFQ